MIWLLSTERSSNPDLVLPTGPIVRISPFELHVNDPAFYDQLYRQDGRWNKDAWAYDAFSAKGPTICTPDHDLHKARRQALAPFFSKAKIVSRQELIYRNVSRLCERIAKFAQSEQLLNLGAATSAFTRDVATEFLLGRTYNNLEQEDFNIGVTHFAQDSGHVWRMTKHVRWFGPTMRKVPMSWNMKSADESMKNFMRFLQASCAALPHTIIDLCNIFLTTELQRSQHDTKELMIAADSPNPDDKNPRTMVHEILESKLPVEEKSFPSRF